MTREQGDALRRIASVIIEMVAAAGPEFGAPGGHLYNALMTRGCSFPQYEQLMAGLVAAKMLRKSGQCYFVVNR